MGFVWRLPSPAGLARLITDGDLAAAPLGDISNSFKNQQDG
jgi:hypothetical protein